MSVEPLPRPQRTSTRRFSYALSLLRTVARRGHRFLRRYALFAALAAGAVAGWQWHKNAALDEQNRFLFKEQCVQMQKPATQQQREDAEKKCAAMQRYSAAEGVGPMLVLAVAYGESGLRAAAVGYRPDGRGCDFGVMQINTCVHNVDAFDCDVLRNVSCNIQRGVKMLAEELRFFNGDERLALLAYNRGRSAVLADLRDRLDPTWRSDYASPILARRARLGV